MVALLYYPYRFAGRVETALKAVSVFVRELSEMRGEGRSIRQIARELGVSRQRLLPIVTSIFYRTL